MGLKRRQFLTLAGAAGSLCFPRLAHRLFAATETSVNNAGSSSAAPSLVGSSDRANPTQISQLTEGLFNPPRGDVRLAVISDLNSQYGSTQYEPEVDKAIALMPTWAPDIVLCGGDMVAGQDDSLSQQQIQAMWAAFDRHVAAPLRQAAIPYGFTIGNHDASGARARNGNFLFTKDRNAATAYWNNSRHNPGLQFVDRAAFPFYYTFQQDQIFFLVWDASTAQISREQVAWAERSLSSEAAQSARLRIVIGHLPLYAIAIGRDEPGEYLNNADQLRSLLERYNVHTYISGHQHAYYPAHKGQLQLLHSGLLGTGARSLLNGNLRPQKTLTIVDVNLSAADTTYTTYDMRTMQLVNQQQLPKLIAGPNGKVLRRDIEWNDLTPQEQQTHYSPSS